MTAAENASGKDTPEEIGGAASRASRFFESGDTGVLLEGLPWLCPNCEKVTNEPYRDVCKLCNAPRSRPHNSLISQAIRDKDGQ